jgi:hypothetical protein
VVLSPIADEFALAREEDKVVGRVPLLDDVEPFLDLAPKRQAVQVAPST